MPTEKTNKEDQRCRCGHLHSEHHPLTSVNYSAGRCTATGCPCAHFLIDTPAIGYTQTKEEAAPKMSFELAALSDFAALEYANRCEQSIGERPYDGSDITEAHEAGQSWMWQKLTESREWMDLQKMVPGITPEAIMQIIQMNHTRIEEYEKALFQAEKKIKQLIEGTAAPAVDWIPVAIGFPPEGRNVLVWVPSRGMAFQAYQFGNLWGGVYLEPAEGVSHWRYMPAGPDDGTEDYEKWLNETYEFNRGEGPEKKEATP